MTHTTVSTVPGTDLAHAHRGCSWRSGAIILALGVMLGGCAKVHDIEVGSIPDDYRTNHPIVISEQEQTMDVPVASGAQTMNYGTKSIVRGFAARYRETASGTVQILTPVGSPNTHAASIIAGDITQTLVDEGIPARRIVVNAYQAEAENDAAPIRLSYRAIAAHTNQCGQWPEDLVTNTMENKHYKNFGCATQNNLAAQLANPADLIAPRDMTPIDAQRRDTVIGLYRKNGSTLEE